MPRAHREVFREFFHPPTQPCLPPMTITCSPSWRFAISPAFCADSSITCIRRNCRRDHFLDMARFNFRLNSNLMQKLSAPRGRRCKNYFFHFQCFSCFLLFVSSVSCIAHFRSRFLFRFRSVFRFKILSKFPRILLLFCIQNVIGCLVYIEIQPVCIERVGEISPCKNRNAERVVVLIIIARKFRIQSLFQITVILVI